MTQAFLSEPPEGATSGDSIPRENEELERQKQELDTAVAVLKTVEAYHGKSERELREIAKEKLL